MAGKAGSSKEDIRRMMRQVAAKMSSAKQPAASSAPSAEDLQEGTTAAAAESVRGHPFARFNSLNQLTCILCGCLVKSSLLWRAHLVSRQHRDNSDALRSQGADRAAAILSGAGLKRRAQEAALAKPPIPGQRGLGLAYSDDEGDGDGEKSGETKRRSESSALSGGKSAASAPVSRKRQHQSQQAQLPEGFFDDPVADARARHVPYRDKMEEELELFAREMRDTQAESEMMAEAAEEEADNVRYLEEIIAQEETWHRLNDLELMKEAAAIKQEAQAALAATVKSEEAEAADADSDVDEAEELDWRKKRL